MRYQRFILFFIGKNYYLSHAATFWNSSKDIYNCCLNMNGIESLLNRISKSFKFCHELKMGMHKTLHIY